MAFLKNGGTRLGLFFDTWKAYGKGRFWYQGTGPWSHTYEDVDKILRSNQDRSTAFYCVNAPVPDIFSERLLIFMSNSGTGEDEWKAIRIALHNYFLSGAGDYAPRIAKLPAFIAADWPKPQLSEMSDKSHVMRMVVKCVFYVMFGRWLDDADATVLSGWRAEAGAFVLPRLAHRILCNRLVNQVKQLRRDTIDIIEAQGLMQVFIDMNESLPSKYRRTPVVRLADEIMFVIGFAGIGGTSACVESCGAFLQAKKSAKSASERIDFGRFKTSAEMVEVYRENPVRYIKEVCRLDPPVACATHVLKEDTETTMAGRKVNFPVGTRSQHVMALSNRDENVWETPDVFMPSRQNLDKAHTWNGCFPEDEDSYPRICPGRYFALDVAKAILNHAVAGEPGFVLP